MSDWPGMAFCRFCDGSAWAPSPFSGWTIAEAYRCCFGGTTVLHRDLLAGTRWNDFRRGMFRRRLLGRWPP